MRTIQCIKIIVDWEGCRRPAGGCGVTRRAICRQVERHVVGIYGLVEVGGMTSSALCRRTRIPCSVTFHTIGCQVFARQGETRRVVVKNNICISRGVAGQTSRAIVGIAVYTVVIIISLRVCVAGCTGIFSIVGWVGMAIRTSTPFSIVLSAVNGEVLRVVVKY